LAVVDVERPLVTLTTDFGEEDNYVGIIKGIITFINNRVQIIDNSNNVPPFNIEAGRYLLETSYLNFPPGSIHLAVVDPEVGTKRKIVIVETNHCLFVGPDNGLFSFLKRNQIEKIVSITNPKYFLKDISTTFHGRDIMAPVAAYLSLGVSSDEFGPRLKSINRPKRRGVRKVGGKTVGRIIYADHFGNLVTSFKQTDMPSGKYSVTLHDHKIGRPCRTFGSFKIGKPVCYMNSVGYLEIAINQGSAAKYFHIDDLSKEKILIASG
jgi:S-adenosylmethionine hydrolase